MAAPTASSCCPRALVLAGSPRSAGTCAELANRVARGLVDAGCEALVRRLTSYDIAGCTGCGACERTGTCVFDTRELAVAQRGGRPGASQFAGAREAADALVLVAPVFFSGPPSQLKAFFDRLQPYWAQRYILDTRHAALPLDERKPFELVVVGAGGDPFGYDPLVQTARSALRMLDFELTAVHEAIGPQRRDPAMFERACTWGANLGARVR